MEPVDVGITAGCWVWGDVVRVFIVLGIFSLLVGVGVVVGASLEHGFRWLYLVGGLGWAGVAGICSLLVIRIISPWP